jgi:hypothetical protein
VVEGFLEKKLLFERPSIEHGVNNLVQYKCSHLSATGKQELS